MWVWVRVTCGLGLDVDVGLGKMWVRVRELDGLSWFYCVSFSEFLPGKKDGWGKAALQILFNASNGCQHERKTVGQNMTLWSSTFCMKTG